MTAFLKKVVNVTLHSRVQELPPLCVPCHIKSTPSFMEGKPLCYVSCDSLGCKSLCAEQCSAPWLWCSPAELLEEHKPLLETSSTLSWEYAKWKRNISEFAGCQSLHDLLQEMIFESEEERLKSKWRSIPCCCTEWTTVPGGLTHDGKRKCVIPAWVEKHSLGQEDADRERHHRSRDGGTIKIWMQVGYYLWLLCWHLMSTLMSCQKQCS